MRKGRLVDKPGSGTGRWRESVLGRGRRVIDGPGTNGRAGEAAGRDLTVSWQLQGGSAGGAERALHLRKKSSVLGCREAWPGGMVSEKKA
ncbi:unnamed protein product [Rangifer tarandus platyrhynchus]|uniref:Uncharacterized protein n=1 Tax=Rangifer tarandus platyrhynchus TaxID=3082113 RepID=A0AC59Z7D9_RANTA